MVWELPRKGSQRQSSPSWPEIGHLMLPYETWWKTVTVFKDVSSQLQHLRSLSRQGFPIPEPRKYRKEQDNIFHYLVPLAKWSGYDAVTRLWVPGNRSSKICCGQLSRKWLHILKLLFWATFLNHSNPNSFLGFWLLSILIHGRPYFCLVSPTLLIPQPLGKVWGSQDSSFKTEMFRLNPTWTL